MTLLRGQKVAQILEMREKKRQLTAKKGFQGWTRRFTESYDENTRLEDLSDSTLEVLIRGGEESSMPLYELILGVKGLGMGPRFYFMESGDKMAVMDITLFLLDQLRFEAMRRLGWVEDHPTFHAHLVDLVEQFTGRFSAIRNQTPPLSPGHPRYREYAETYEGDRSAFVRRLIPQVLEVFGKDEGERNP
jgi:hypothetical protein